jgi:hypothetical protein
VINSLEPCFPTSNEGDRLVLWPEGSDTSLLVPFRSGSADRELNIPLVELASLPLRFVVLGLQEQEVIH